MSPSRTVFVVDDHKVFVQLLTLALEAEPDLRPVGSACDVISALDGSHELRPDVVIMDVQIGDGDGIAATHHLTRTQPAICVVVLTAYPDDRLVQRAADAGACALLAKDGDLTRLIDTVRAANRDNFVLDPGLVGHAGSVVGPAQLLPPLSRSETEILRRLAVGFEPPEIAGHLGLTAWECRGQIDTILSKLGARSTLDAVIVAMGHGLIDVGPAN